MESGSEIGRLPLNYNCTMSYIIPFLPVDLYTGGALFSVVHNVHSFQLVCTCNRICCFPRCGPSSAKCYDRSKISSPVAVRRGESIVKGRKVCVLLIVPPNGGRHVLITLGSTNPHESSEIITPSDSLADARVTRTHRPSC